MLCLKKFVDALPIADEILRLDSENITAHIRRAKAISMSPNAKKNDYSQAIADLEKVKVNC